MTISLVELNEFDLFRKDLFQRSLDASCASDWREMTLSSAFPLCQARVSLGNARQTIAFVLAVVSHPAMMTA
jgi:hypothetical protein